MNKLVFQNFHMGTCDLSYFVQKHSDFVNKN